MRVLSYIHDNEQLLRELKNFTINEAYFGDGPIIKLQESFSKFRKKYIEKEFNTKMNVDPDLLKFNREVESQFGYQRFALTIMADYRFNAYMVNIGFLDSNAYTNSKNSVRINKTSTGFMYSKDSGITAMCGLYAGLFVDSRFTDRELLAILLHEIGHSFTNAILNKNGLFNRVGYMSSLLNKIKDICSKISIPKENISNTIIMNLIEKDFSKLDIFSKFRDMIIRPSKMISVSLLSREGMKKNLKHDEYTDEKFADTFAAMYGYGEDIHTALLKMPEIYMSRYTGKTGYEKKNVLSNVFRLGMLMFNNWLEFLSHTQDEHPDGVTRIVTYIEYLENELSKENIDPLLRNDLMKSLENQKKTLQEYLDIKDDDKLWLLKMYYKKLYEKFNGDRREKVTDNKALFDTIDDTYDQLKETADIEKELDPGEEIINEEDPEDEINNIPDDENINPDPILEGFIKDLLNKSYQKKLMKIFGYNFKDFCIKLESIKEFEKDFDIPVPIITDKSYYTSKGLTTEISKPDKYADEIIKKYMRCMSHYLIAGVSVGNQAPILKFTPEYFKASRMATKIYNVSALSLYRTILKHLAKDFNIDVKSKEKNMR